MLMHNTNPRMWGSLTLKPGRSTHRPQSSSFLGLPYRILNMNPKKELLRGLWVASVQRLGLRACTPFSKQQNLSHPRTDISISILPGYPYLVGLQYKGVSTESPFLVLLMCCLLKNCFICSYKAQENRCFYYGSEGGA